MLTKSDKRRDHYLKKTYGISLKKYNQMWESQKGCCACCGKAMKKSKRLIDRPVVDHCHTTNKVRSLLHGMCNMLVGLVEVHNVKVDCAIIYADKWNVKRTKKMV